MPPRPHHDEGVAVRRHVVHRAVDEGGGIVAREQNAAATDPDWWGKRDVGAEHRIAIPEGRLVTKGSRVLTQAYEEAAHFSQYVGFV
jgi:hypothetical protein